MAVKSPQQKKSLVIAQEIKFARVLAGNHKNARAKKLKKLRTWLTLRSRSSIAFTEEDFMRLWKGLYYAMWMSDKPLVQEECAESISQLVFCFNCKDVALLYTKCALNTLNIEWFGIDQYRLDKFEMLARRIIRQSFTICKRHSWNEEWVKGFADIIDSLLSAPKGSLGFRFHIIEVFMEELSKVSEGYIPEDLVTELLRPFAKYLGSLRDEREIRHVTKHIFRYLIFQSDVGMEYLEKFEAWKQAGYPMGNIDAMSKVEVDEDDEENDLESDNEEDEVQTDSGEKPLDPRAGRVDVELPQVPFDAEQVVELLQEYKRQPSSIAKTRRLVKKLIYEFTNLSQGEMPIGVKTVEVFKKKPKDINPSKAAARFLAFEDKLYSDSKLRRLRKKKRKRTLELETNGVDNEEEEEEEEEEAPVEKPKLKKRKVVEESQLVTESPEKVLKKKTKRVSNLMNGIEAEEVLEKSKSKKQKVVEDEDQVIAESPEKVSKKKLSKQVNKIINGDVTDKSQLKKSLQKKSEVNTKKVKTNKLKSRRNSIMSQMYDEIEDFSNFKAGLQSKNKTHVKYDLDSSWDISINECPSIPTSPVIKPPISTSSATPSPSTPKSCLINKNVNIGLLSTPQFPPLKKITQEKVSVEASIANDTGSSGKKRVKIVLDRNTAQNTSEYMKQLRSSPAIPFDANRRPLAGVLKPSPMSSPINPFYKRSM